MAIMGSGLGLLLLMIPLFILILSSQATAHKFYVGGNEGWVLKPSESYNHWAARTRFLVNDTLYFKYKVGSDSVLVVKENDYVSCNTKNPIHRMDDGDSEFRLDNSGPFYFISGNVKHCRHGQKLVVVVLGRHTPTHHYSPSPSPATPPSVSPSPATPPSVSPSPATPPSVSPSPASPPSVSPSPATPPSVSPPATPPSVSPSPATSPSVSPSPATPPSVSPSPATPPSVSPSPATSPAVSPSPAISESPAPSEGRSGVNSPAPTPAQHHSGSTRFGGLVGVAIGLGVAVALLLA